ncbi:MAG TPA: selenocysteine-specific translation elongation factor [Pyrinomonadaceae bacterium]|nr:selenocysteine-specific translation elongation factor [Pyrinomonadaceae bacterium]
MQSLIVGTAGHIDHGKSALVRALTGTDPDRLPEEKRRGITIDLGFADLDLGDVRLGFVDVPGHERFVKNMLAGAHGIDVLALVIAADEGVMPQTREHFDICRLLGVQHGLVVITKKDLVDDEMLSLVESEAQELVSGSFLRDAPIVAVSARTGVGLDQLKTALKEIAGQVPPRSTDYVTRLPVDRAFSMKGFGAVVTGTLVSGEIAEGDELELLPRGMSVRVRGTQVHGHAVPKAIAGQRTAVNLAGVEVSQLERGMVLAPAGRLRPTQILDAWIDVLPGAPRALRSRARVRVHVGAAEVLGRVRVLETAGEIPPGKAGLAQLRLEAPLVALHGDRFIIRSYSPAVTIAGGIVVDPFANKHRGKEVEQARARLLTLTGTDRATKFATFTQAAEARGLRLTDIVAKTGWTPKVSLAIAAQAQAKASIIDAGGVLLSASRFNQFRRVVSEELEQHHKREPLARGMLRETLREKLFVHSQPEVFGFVISSLEKDGVVVAEKDLIRLAKHSIDLSAEDARLRDLLAQMYEKAGLEAPSIDEAMTRAGVAPAQKAYGRRILQLLIDSRRIVRVQGDMFVSAQAIQKLVDKLREFGSAHQPDRLIDVATFKDLAGVSRKYAIPLLEHLDRERVTRRAGDKRVILP